MKLREAVSRCTCHVVRQSLVAAALLLVGTGVSRGQVVQNGTFDVTEPGAFWAAANIDGSGGWRATGGNPGGMFILNDNGNPATDPTITQTIFGLVPSAVYAVSGDFARFH